MESEVHSMASQEIAEAVISAIEAKWGDALHKIGVLPRIRTAADATRRDVALMLHKIDGVTVEGCGRIRVLYAQGNQACAVHALVRDQEGEPRLSNPPLREDGTCRDSRGGRLHRRRRVGRIRRDASLMVDVLPT